MKPTTRDIVLGTTNQGKLEELRDLLGELPVRLRSLSEFAAVDEPQENGSSFAENARIKALAYSSYFRVWALADDSGLSIDALEGRPGIYSARYAGCGDPERSVRDRANNEKVLGEMEGIPEENRTARFHCALCLAAPEGVLLEVTGQMEGVIAREAQGERGFGYDPIVYLPDQDCTVAQLPREEKNRRSHRAEALEKFKSRLDDLLTLAAKTLR